MKEKIIIIGSGQHARVVLYNLKCQGKYEVFGVLSNDFLNGVKLFEEYPILGTQEDRERVRQETGINKFFIAFGSMQHRKTVFENFIKEGWESVNIIHPTAVIAPEAKLGNGILVEAGCYITPNPVIGNNVVVNIGSQINHDNVVANHVYIASGVVLSGGVFIGENTLLDDGVIVSIGRKVTHDCIIGAGAVVTKDLSDTGKYVGVPARKI